MRSSCAHNKSQPNARRVKEIMYFYVTIRNESGENGKYEEIVDKDDRNDKEIESNVKSENVMNLYITESACRVKENEYDVDKKDKGKKERPRLLKFG
jgi:hypothetical protein